MAYKKQLVGEICREYLDKFPNVPSLTLAKKLFKEQPLYLTRSIQREPSLEGTGASRAKNKDKS
jgi:hypothetical protein